ncbi:MAG: hypothetical protein Q7R85_01030 [bacterium]|nr:hypothetical protein [bacterium]
MRPLRAVSPEISDEHFNPAISEILLLGGVARGKDVKRLNLAIFDYGFYSRVFWDRIKRVEDATTRTALLHGNLRVLFKYWFGFDDRESEFVGAFDEPVNLHVLPIDFLTNDSMRRMVKGAVRMELRRGRKREVKGRGWNPRLFPCVLDSFLRYDAERCEFMPADIACLEEKYNCDLADLRVRELTPVLVPVQV